MQLYSVMVQSKDHVVASVQILKVLGRNGFLGANPRPDFVRLSLNRTILLAELVPNRSTSIGPFELNPTCLGFQKTVVDQTNSLQF